MRAIRKYREAVAREIPLKLEADVERAFRQFCRNDGMRASGTALFCRPAEKAGEVWALDTAYASAGEIGPRNGKNECAQTPELFAGPPAARARPGRQCQGKGRAPRRGDARRKAERVKTSEDSAS